MCLYVYIPECKATDITSFGAGVTGGYKAWVLGTRLRFPLLSMAYLILGMVPSMCAWSKEMKNQSEIPERKWKQQFGGFR